MKKDLEDLKDECDFQIDKEDLDLTNGSDREKFDKEKLRVTKAKSDYKNARNKTYLKGQRGVRRYYDEDKAFPDKDRYVDDYEDDCDEEEFEPDESER